MELHSILITAHFGFIGVKKASESEQAMTGMLRALFWITLIGVLAITVFYLYEYIIHV